MNLEELYKIKEEQSKKMLKMTPEEITSHYEKVMERLFAWAGKENFIPTDNPNVWKHIAKK